MFQVTLGLELSGQGYIPDKASLGSMQSQVVVLKVQRETVEIAEGFVYFCFFLALCSTGDCEARGYKGKNFINSKVVTVMIN